MAITAFSIKNRCCSYLLLPFALIMTMAGLFVLGISFVMTLAATASAKVNFEFPDNILPKIQICYGFSWFMVSMVALPERCIQFGPQDKPWLAIQPHPPKWLRLKAIRVTEPWDLCKNSYSIIRKNIKFVGANFSADIQFNNPVQTLIATLILSFIESSIPKSRIKTEFLCCHRYQMPKTNAKLNLECHCRCRLLPMIVALRRQLKKHTE